MNVLLATFLLSLVPVGELRIALPFALALGVNPFFAFLVSVLGNLVIIPLVYFFLEFVHHRFLHYDHYQNIFDRFMERTRKKVSPKIARWGYLGLALFVAVPLPVTGAYTGTLAAWFFGLDKYKSFLAISLGVLIAGLIILFAGLGILQIS